MSVQIQCLSRLEINGGGQEWVGPVFPHPTIKKEHSVS